MPAIIVSEEDLEAVAGAALEAESIGDIQEARALDKLAQKINAALSGDRQMIAAWPRVGLQDEKSAGRLRACASIRTADPVLPIAEDPLSL